MNLSLLEERIGYSFTTPRLLEQALTHRSFSADHNERLEFLGDSALNCAVSLTLYQRFPKAREGELSRLRANLVRQESLQALAVEIGLSDFLKLGEGELKSGGTERPSILADAWESLIGAVFVDGGFSAVQTVIDTLLSHQIPREGGAYATKDAKTQLQECLQSRRLPLPSYTVLSTIGAEHCRQFEVSCAVEAMGIQATGSGKTRRAAEQAAAQAALERLGK